ncbi:MULTISPECIES: hypothetical protein [unclassified Moorena]|uniref:hypothetical protein n=1 Tax=unclassified Moorena TaxID=2683338 RepID=UPI0013FEE3AA|nr:MULTISPECIES: hypothetical protein [unclassified Moorena]NEO15283.1 hypothetical protein [Moorena sp. SIO3E8]NEQ01618.1 hypothetical protein [Moorena sp. SIO3F7]
MLTFVKLAKVSLLPAPCSLLPAPCSLLPISTVKPNFVRLLIWVVNIRITEKGIHARG